MAKYTVEEDGRILQEGKTIGSFNHDTGEISLDEELGPAAAIYVKARVLDLMVAKTKDRSRDEPEGKPLIEIFSPAQETAPQEQVKSPAPPQDPRLGDKTPAYRHWFKTNHSQEEYEKKYGGRKVSDQPGEMYGGGDIPESQVWKDNPEVWFKTMK